MKTIEEIQARKESQTFDCKSIQIDPKALAIPIVAMANADGGVLAIGVSDKTRRVEGIDGNEERLNELLRVPFDFCNPSVKVKCEYLPCTDHSGKENRILLMHIPASSQLHTNQADECFMRVGDKSKKLSFDERMQLLYDKGERYYEDKDVFGATMDDIDMNLVNDYMSVIGYGKSGMEFLRENNDFVAEIDGQQKISTACILLFGKNPQRFFPRARTRFIRYEGKEEKVGREMNVVKDVTFEGAILQQVRSTIDYLETQVREHSFLGDAFILKATLMAEWTSENEFDRPSAAQVPPKYRPSTAQVEKLISVMSSEYIGVQEIMNLCGIVRRKTIQDSYITPALADGSIERKYPNQPKRPDQKYRLTDLAMEWKKSDGGL